jgi:hypothetical protein
LLIIYIKRWKNSLSLYFGKIFHRFYSKIGLYDEEIAGKYVEIYFISNQNDSPFSHKKINFVFTINGTQRKR